MYKCVAYRGNISEDICLIFDTMYLQKNQEYFLGEMTGGDDEGQLYNGLVCFLNVGLNEPIQYMIKSSLETNINANYLKTKPLDSLKILSSCRFCVRAIVCENHPSNVSSFKKLLE